MKTSIPILAAAALLLAGAAEAQTQQTYRYDANGRLIAATTAQPSSGTWSSYALDDADNRTSRNNATIAYPADTWRMAAGERLLPGQQLTSKDGRFALKVQQDGNLVLWFGSTPLWASGTATGRSVYLHNNGDLVSLTDPAGSPLWFLPPAGGTGVLILQNDGNLVLKTSSAGSVVWQSNTCCH